MSGVKITIDGKEYEAVNAAEESTLQDILEVMTSQSTDVKKQTSIFSKNQANQTVSTKKSNTALDSFGKAARKTEDTLSDLEHAADEAGGTLLDSAKSVAGGFASAVKSISSGLETGDISVKNVISDVGESLAKGMSGLGAMVGTAFGPVGTAVGKMIGDTAGAALTAITGAVGVAIGYMEGLQQTVNGLAASGVVFGEGVSKATDNILASGMTLGQFQKVVQESGESLRLLGGSVSTGAKRMSSINKELIPFRDQFTNLGFSFEEMPGLVAEYASSLERFGGTINKMSDADLAKNTYEYAKNLRVIADVTGMDAKAAKEKIQQAATDARLQDYYFKMQAAGVSDISLRMGNVSAELDKMDLTGAFKEFLIYGQVIGDKAVEVAQSPYIQELFAKTAASLGDPTVKIEKFQDNFYQGLQDTAAGIQEDVKRMAPIAAISAKLGESALNNLGIINQRMDELRKLYENGGVAGIRKGIDDAAINAAKDKTVEGLAALASGQQTIKESMQSLASSLTQGATWIITPAIKALAGAISGTADMVHTMVNGVDITELKQKIKGNQDFQSMNKGDGLSSNPFAQLELKRDLNVLVDTLRDAGKSDEAITNELGKLGVKLEDGLFVNDFIKIDPDQFSQIAEPILIPQAPQQPSGPTNNTPQNPTPPPPDTRATRAFAYGDIVKPKSGGHIVKVAEAGQAEAILPTERTQSGQLGVKMTGDLIDSSTLMKTLVDANKGSNALLSSLITRMDTMNNNFEKLVSSQRQANRLAV